MKEYPKIQSIYKRDEETHKFLEGEWSLPEFEYLANNQWLWTEKVDGTNIRVIWVPEGFGDLSLDQVVDPCGVTFKGKTDNADIPKFLLSKLGEMFPNDKFREYFSDTPICLYGEGFGAKIQKGGGNYIPNGVSFILIDVWIDGWWLNRENICDVALKLGIDVVPIIKYCTILEAIDLVRDGFISTWSSHNASVTGRCHEFQAEGLVGKPLIELKDRKGERILTKLKTKDFPK